MQRTTTALITGAGGALAAALIERLETSGWRCVLVDRGPAERVTARYPGRLARSVDLTDESSARRALAELEAASGGIDVLINVAGGFAVAPVAELDVAALQAQLDVNLITMSVATAALLPGMLARGSGVVVGIAAGQASDGGAKVAHYAAAKAAVVAYLRSLDKELASRGVRSLVVYPMGTLDTAANRSAMPDADANAWIDPLALADAIVHALSMGPRARLQELRVWPDPPSAQSRQ